MSYIILYELSKTKQCDWIFNLLGEIFGEIEFKCEILSTDDLKFKLNFGKSHSLILSFSVTQNNMITFSYKKKIYPIDVIEIVIIKDMLFYLDNKIFI